LFTLASFAFVIGLLVFVHEMGHYLAARWFGVKADVFSIGFGREMIGWTDRQGTRWKVAWLPLGGYVRFAGDMNAASEPTPAWLAMPPAERNRTFQCKPLWQRAIIVAAGPLINFGFAILIYMGFFMAYGQPMTPPVAGLVMPGSPAAMAGIKVNDRLLSVDDIAVARFEDIARIVQVRAGEALPITLRRGDELLSLTVTPADDPQRDRFGNVFHIGRIGIGQTSPIWQPVPWYRLPDVATREVGHTLGSMVDAIGQIMTGRRSIKEMGGPLKIAQYSGQQAARGFESLIMFVALISINLGFINLLPVPMLDGGHLLLYAAEAVIRRPIPPKVQERAFRTGFALLMGLMVFVTLLDLGSFGLWDRISGLIG
jgi:regulator of sigma E protease